MTRIYCPTCKRELDAGNNGYCCDLCRLGHLQVLKQRRAGKDTVWFGTKLSGYHRRALRKGWGFDLTIEWMQTHWNNNCYYCGIYPDKPTVDRKDNNRGYTKENSVIACERCNYFKGRWLTAEQMLAVVTLLKWNQEEKA